MPRFSSSRTSDPSLKRGGGWVNFCSVLTPGVAPSWSTSPSARSGRSASASSSTATAAAGAFSTGTTRAAPPAAARAAASAAAGSPLSSSPANSRWPSVTSSQPANFWIRPVARTP